MKLLIIMTQELERLHSRIQSLRPIFELKNNNLEISSIIREPIYNLLKYYANKN